MAISSGIKVRGDIEVPSLGANYTPLSLTNQSEVQAYIRQVARIAAGEIPILDRESASVTSATAETTENSRHMSGSSGK